MKARLTLFVLLVTLGFSAPARGAVITLDFSATADVSSWFGGSDSTAVAGSFSWDSTAAPLFDGGNIVDYPLLNGSVSIDGAAVPLSSSSFIQIRNDVGFDLFGVFLLFDTDLDLDGGPAPDLSQVWLTFNMPESALPGALLPDDAQFLSEVLSFSLALRDTTGSGFAPILALSVSQPVPEPATMLLLASGLGAILRRSRESR